MPKPRRKSAIRAAALRQTIALKDAADKRAAFLQPRVRSWHDIFLAALRSGQSVRAATASAGLSRSGVYKARQSDPGFRAAWDDAAGAARSQRQQRQATALGTHWIARILPARSAISPFNDACQRFNDISAPPGPCALGPPEVDSRRASPTAHAPLASPSIPGYRPSS